MRIFPVVLVASLFFSVCLQAEEPHAHQAPKELGDLQTRLRNVDCSTPGGRAICEFLRDASKKSQDSPLPAIRERLVLQPALSPTSLRPSSDGLEIIAVNGMKGFSVGDQIMEADNVRLSSPDQLISIIENARSRGVPMILGKVIVGGETRFSSLILE